jgi:hypothetical protein
MELAERIELSTSPLPRECSATELRQHYWTTIQSYRERARPSITRKAKNPSRTQVRERNLPGSIVCQARRASTASTIRETIMRPLLAGVKSTELRCEVRAILERETGIEPATNSLEGCDSTTELLPPVTLVRAKAPTCRCSRPRSKISGAQGRIRTSVTRRVADLQSAAINRSATCASCSVPLAEANSTESPNSSAGPVGTVH